MLRRAATLYLLIFPFLQPVNRALICGIEYSLVAQEILGAYAATIASSKKASPTIREALRSNLRTRIEAS